MLSNQEIRLMLQAIGAGLGREDFRLERLRYHKIVIMTDADVDGSHIRTLLLTFFFRQTPELVERGHVYIAQPPLFRVAHGKAVSYIKDAEGLNSYLIGRVTEKLRVTTASGGVYEGPRLARLLRDLIKFEFVLDRLGQHGYSRSMIFELLDMGLFRKEQLADRERMGEVVARLKAAGYQTTDLAPNEEHGTLEFECCSRREGAGPRRIIGYELIGGVEYQNLRQIHQDLTEMGGPPYTVHDGEDFVTDKRLDLLHRILEVARKGLTIQRFKGLGEMNPEQLWETTMDPERRRLLQVRVEDGVAADQTFTVLMGDQVEPRRQFIEENALRVANLDV
jgi:DNA gyrase subunit B